MTNNSTPNGVSIAIEPFNLANVTGSLTASDTFLAAAEGGMRELGDLLNSDGTLPPTAVVGEIVNSILLLLVDAKARVVAVRDGLRATDALPVKNDATDTPAPPTEFSLHYHAWRTAVDAFETHCAAHEPADDASDLMTAYESSYAPLVDAMYDAAFAAIYTAAANGGEIELKRKVFELQQLDTLSPQEMKPLLDAIEEDASRFVGHAK